MKLLLALFLLICVQKFAKCALTEKQIAATSKLIRNMCQPKSKVTDEQLVEMHKGNFDDSKKLMCFIDCCYNMFKVMKNGEFDYEAAIAAMETLPEPRRSLTKASFSNCRDRAVGDQKCEPAYNLAKCIFLDNPSNDLLP